MIENDNPRQWQENYEKIAIFRVHYNLYEIKRCPICQKLIEDCHIEAFRIETESIKGFEMR